MKYILTSKQLEGSLLFEYENGIIKQFTNEAKMTVPQLKWLADHFPVAEKMLIKMARQYGWQLREVQQDLSFEAFWNRYAYKVGNKKRAERLWNKLSEANKIKALNYLSYYDGFLLNNPSINKLYPETYLNQERWNN